MRDWNGRILLAAALMLLAPVAGAVDHPADTSTPAPPEPTLEPSPGPAGESAAIASENPPIFLLGFCTGQKQYDCTWPQSNCETALDAPGIDCSIIGKVCGRVFYKDTSNGCCSTQGAYECISASSCTPGGWWQSCSQLCGPCELP